MGMTRILVEIKQASNVMKKNWRYGKFWKSVYAKIVFSHFGRRNAIYVVDEQWDNLIILDACRYDIFRQLNCINGQLRSKISKGSDTREFLVQNFGKHPGVTNFSNIAYITGNPMVNHLINQSLVSNSFCEVFPVWDYGWDDHLHTVPPEAVRDEALKARQKYPDKRLIIHFMQPHFPSLTGRFRDIGLKEFRGALRSSKTNEFTGMALNELPMDLFKAGRLKKEEIVAAYEENLKMCLACVKDLLQGLRGRTVVTSDHGEMFGEKPSFPFPFILYPFRVFGHPGGLHIEQLVTVPWLVAAQ